MGTIEQRELMHKGRKFDFERVHFTTSRGSESHLEIVRHPGAVCILPILKDANGEPPRIVMIRNFRPALERTLWELPAGTLEPGEEPIQCAEREVIEETGFRAGNIVPLGTFFTTPGMTNELMHAFAATDLEHIGQQLEQDEDIQVEPKGMCEVDELIRTGELKDGKSLVTWMLAERAGLLGRVGG